MRSATGASLRRRRIRPLSASRAIRRVDPGAPGHVREQKCRSSVVDAAEFERDATARDFLISSDAPTGHPAICVGDGATLESARACRSLCPLRRSCGCL